MDGRILALTAALVLAGCVGGTGSSSPSEAPAGPGDVEGNVSTVALEEPAAWSVGDWWTYEVGGAAIEETREASFVVADATEASYVAETTDRGLAFYDERFDASYLGPQSRDARAGSQDGQDVRYFEWPLVPNASWSTTWDGIERDVEVVAVEGSTAELVAYGPDGGVDVRYTYDAEAGWFGEFRFFEDGTEVFTLELVDDGTDFEKAYVTVDLRTVADANLTAPTAGFSWTEAVPASADDFWYEAAYAAGPGFVGAGYNHANGTESGGDAIVQAACPCGPETVEGTVEATAADWHWQGGLTSSEGYLDVTIYLRDFTSHGLGNATGGY